jgi:hypothetical protein
MNRRGADRPLRLVAKDLVSSQSISWPAVWQFWDAHRADAGLDVIAALFHGTCSHTHTHTHAYINHGNHAPHWHAGVAKKKEKLPAQLAREMVDK